jgi:hypothetical protein
MPLARSGDRQPVEGRQCTLETADARGRRRMDDEMGPRSVGFGAMEGLRPNRRGPPRFGHLRGPDAAVCPAHGRGHRDRSMAALSRASKARLGEDPVLAELSGSACKERGMPRVRKCKRFGNRGEPHNGRTKLRMPWAGAGRMIRPTEPRSGEISPIREIRAESESLPRFRQTLRGFPVPGPWRAGQCTHGTTDARSKARRMIDHATPERRFSPPGHWADFGTPMSPRGPAFRVAAAYPSPER